MRHLKFQKNFLFFRKLPHLALISISRTPPTAPLPNCLPPYFAEGEKFFGIFSSKRPFFFYRKKGGGLTAPPLIFSKFWSEGGGAVDWNYAGRDLQPKALQKYLKTLSHKWEQ